MKPSDSGSARPAAARHARADRQSGRPRRFRALTAALVLGGLLVVPAAALAADPPFKISSADGTSFLTLGFLAQPQLETVTTPDGEATAKNLFLRRIRLVFGGRATSKLTFFIETDSPNLGKDTAAGQKVGDAIFLQDVILTYAFGDRLQVDAGLVLVPLSHNTGQSAASLVAVDFGPYSFLASDPTGSRVGRDYGVQARGYVLGKHVEYRVGTFQGHADPAGTAPFRFAGRVVWYPFETDTGFFYSGTTLGTRRILAIGAGIDHQQDYTAWAADLSLDQPIAGGDGLTFQIDYLHYDGGATFAQLPAQGTWLVEAGYYRRQWQVGPFAQVSGRNYADAGLPGETKVIGGLAWWISGHRFNLKAGAGRIFRESQPGRTQVVVQGQVFLY